MNTSENLRTARKIEYELRHSTICILNAATLMNLLDKEEAERRKEEFEQILMLLKQQISHTKHYIIKFQVEERREMGGT